MVHARGAYERPKGAIDVETFANLDALPFDARPYLGHNGEMEPKGLPMTRETMTRAGIAVLIYSMVNAVLFGAGLILVLTLPVLSAHAGIWISVVVGASLILAAPIAWWIAPRLRARFGKGKAEGTTTAGQR